MSDEGIDLTALEALIFASDGPASAASIRRAFPHLAPGAITPAVAEINARLHASGRPYEIAEIAAGWQFRTRPEFAEVILAAKPERKIRLSRAALETLALVAYRQPLSRAEIEDLRGVDCGAVMKSLLEREFVRIVGRRDAPGRPALFGTTPGFLETFGLRALSDLPPLREVEALIVAQSASDDGEASALEPVATEAREDDAPSAPEWDAAADVDDFEAPGDESDDGDVRFH
jgi:segregation and condensation protein B